MAATELVAEGGQMNRRRFLHGAALASLIAAVPATAAPFVRTGVGKLFLDTTVLSRQIAEFVSLALEAGHITEPVNYMLNGLLDELARELVFGGDVTTTGTGQHVVEVRLREGGKFDACITALRALCEERGFVHGASV